MSEIKEHTTQDNSPKDKKSIFRRFSDIPTSKKIQIAVASLLTVAVFVSVPTYSWFKMQKEMERFERINSPDTLFVTAAHKEDTMYLDMGQMKVTGYWDEDKEDPMQHKYYVFSVAGKYVTEYTLQLAHTSNNNYRYEIYEAEFSKTDPRTVDEDNDGILDHADWIDGRDFISYKVTEDYPDSLDFPTIADRKDKDGNSVEIKANDILYYTIRKDTSGELVSLNVSNYGETVEGQTVTSKSYTVKIPGTENTTTVTYNGHYLNHAAGFTANSSGTYHNQTYGENYTYVESHAEPLYWLASGIPVDGSDSRDPFYHEYILKISWNGAGDATVNTILKDTDIVCITAGVE